MAGSPDVPVLAGDLKKRILAWANTYIPVQSEWYQPGGDWHFLDENLSWGYAMGGACAVMATMHRYDTSLVVQRNLCVESVESVFTWNLRDPVMTASRYSYPLTPTYPATVYKGIPDGGTRLMNPFDGGPWGNPDPLGSDENTTFEAIASIVWIADELYNAGLQTPGAGIDRATCERWMTNLSYAADWLIYWNGNPTWHTNGNFVSHQALCYTQMARLYRQLGGSYPRGDSRRQAHEDNWFLYQQAYELTMQTLIYPLGNGYSTPSGPINSTMWTGYGYNVTVAGPESTPTVPALRNPNGCGTDGNGETGHLTETAGYQGQNPVATEDYYYETVTLGILATIYTVNRDWRIMYLLNAGLNSIDARIAWGTTYNVDCTGGSRKSFTANAEDNYHAVVALIGRRQGNRSRLTSAHMLAMFDISSIGSLVNFAGFYNNQLPSSAGRLWRTGIATLLKACYLTDKKV